jgi:hypothetical protein
MLWTAHFTPTYFLFKPAFLSRKNLVVMCDICRPTVFLVKPRSHDWCIWQICSWLCIVLYKGDQSNLFDKHFYQCTSQISAWSLWPLSHDWCIFAVRRTELFWSYRQTARLCAWQVETSCGSAAESLDLRSKHLLNYWLTHLLLTAESFLRS